MASDSSQRPRTPSGSQPPPDGSLSPISESKEKHGSLRRRPSFSFLRRNKSREGVARSASGQSIRSTSGASNSGRKLSKKHRVSSVQDPATRKENIPPQPPRIPDIPRTQQIQTFGGEDFRPGGLAVVPNQANSYVNGDSRLKSMGPVHKVPIPPIPDTSKPFDPYARSESMTHRGRYSYASSAVSTINGPRKVRRKKDPTPFNILVVGARNSGKTSFLSFLRTALSPQSRKQHLHYQEEAYDIRTSPSNVGFPTFTPHYLETEIQGERVGLTLWDSKGFERNVVDLQLREMSSFLESKFEDTFAEENKVARSPGFRDTHVHCVFLMLDPARLDANIAAFKNADAISGAKANGNSFSPRPQPSAPCGLDENLDLQVMRVLQGKTTVIPVIAKADSVTSAHMVHLKRAVWESIKRAKLEHFEAIGLGEGIEDTASDEEQSGSLNPHPLDERKLSDTSHLESASESDSSLSPSDLATAKPAKAAARHSRTPSSPMLFPVRSPPATSTPYLPLSVISPDLYEPDVAGRKFPWGFADPYDAEHCDFVRLKDMVFAEWRGELREASRDIWYEGWRTSRLNRRSEIGEPKNSARPRPTGFTK
ncbi:MAG: hypothetical protein LQ351_007987 [Letrouitia transgressa]|nr:MAG: hypothetical protein LQ351_007987 [Letrouitia transgressa]